MPIVDPSEKSEARAETPQDPTTPDRGREEIIPFPVAARDLASKSARTSMAMMQGANGVGAGLYHLAGVFLIAAAALHEKLSEIACALYISVAEDEDTECEPESQDS